MDRGVALSDIMWVIMQYWLNLIAVGFINLDQLLIILAQSAVGDTCYVAWQGEGVSSDTSGRSLRSFNMFGASLSYDTF